MKIIQISDTHLFASEQDKLFGELSNLKLQRIVHEICNNERNVDYIFLTGDISQDESTQSYENGVKYLSKLNLPIYWIPGNHDQLSLLESVFSRADNFNHMRTLSAASWKFIFLNSQWPGSGIGHLNEEELQSLRAEIQNVNENNIAIVLHHHPIPLGTPLIDSYILQNSAELWAIIEGTKTKLIICGHVHGDHRLVQQGIVLETSPATCYQLPKGITKLEIDARSGYKVFEFDDSGYTARSVMFEFVL